MESPGMNRTPSERSHVPSPEIFEARDAAHEILGAIEAATEFELVKNSAILTDLPPGHLIVRREDPDHVIGLMKSHEPIPISFVGGSPYANSVEWDPSVDGTRGLENAYLEGYSAKNHIVTVFGFEKPEGFQVESLDDSQRVFNGVDRTRVRAASGYVPFEAVQFVTVRIPVHALPENELSEEELDQRYDSEHLGDKKSAFIYRTYIRRKSAGQADETIH